MFVWCFEIDKKKRQKTQTDFFRCDFFCVFQIIFLFVTFLFLKSIFAFLVKNRDKKKIVFFLLHKLLQEAAHTNTKVGRVILERHVEDRSAVSASGIFVGVVAVANLEGGWRAEGVLVEDFAGVVDPHAQVDLVEEQRGEMRNRVAIIGHAPSVFVVDGLAPLGEGNSANAGRTEVEHPDTALGDDGLGDPDVGDLRDTRTLGVASNPDVSERVSDGELLDCGEEGLAQ